MLGALAVILPITKGVKIMTKIPHIEYMCHGLIEGTEIHYVDQPFYTTSKEEASKFLIKTWKLSSMEALRKKSPRPERRVEPDPGYLICPDCGGRKVHSQKTVLGYYQPPVDCQTCRGAGQVRCDAIGCDGRGCDNCSPEGVETKEAARRWGFDLALYGDINKDHRHPTPAGDMFPGEASLYFNKLLKRSPLTPIEKAFCEGWIAALAKRIEAKDVAQRARYALKVKVDTLS